MLIITFRYKWYYIWIKKTYTVIYQVQIRISHYQRLWILEVDITCIVSFIGTLDILEGIEYLLDVFVILGKPKNIPLVVRIIVSSVIKVILRRKHIEDKLQYSPVSIFNTQYVLWSGWWRRLHWGIFSILNRLCFLRFIFWWFISKISYKSYC